MKRITSTTRRLIRLLLCAPIAVLFLSVCTATEEKQQTRSPNFIFILSDDVAQGDLGCYAQELIQNEMLRWVGQQGDKPFFLFYAVTLPHAHHEVDDLGIYRDKPWSPIEKAYAAQVTRLDSDVGKLLETLRETGMDDNTLVIFSGDNGSSFPPDSELGKRFNQASNNLRGFKRGMYEGALRQASIAWWPGTVPAGRVDDQPWAFWDLMPTFVELNGATPPPGYQTDGFSLVDYLKGGQAPQRDYFYWEVHGGNLPRHPLQAARFRQWKAVRNKLDLPIEIYDLANDSAESVNLAATRPDLVERALEILAEAHRPDPNWPLSGHSAKQQVEMREAWKSLHWRRDKHWAPADALPYQAPEE